jgi:KRAB domain-containing zinc finger protein
MRRHMLTHTGEKPHMCVICSKRFSQINNLKQHVLIHTREKNHICPVCSRRFTQMSNFKKHVSRHATTSHVFSDTTPMSGEAAESDITRQSIKKQTLSHTKAHSQSCLICRQTFPSRASLEQHLTTHAGQNQNLL